MTLNKIECIGYDKTPNGFIVLLINTSRDEILQIDNSILNIEADNGIIVETFTGFGKPNKITEYTVKNQFEVFFPIQDETNLRINLLEKELKLAIAELAETILGGQ